MILRKKKYLSFEMVEKKSIWVLRWSRFESLIKLWVRVKSSQIYSLLVLVYNTASSASTAQAVKQKQKDVYTRLKYINILDW